MEEVSFVKESFGRGASLAYTGFVRGTWIGGFPY
jgi:hypothetical protein